MNLRQKLVGFSFLQVSLIGAVLLVAYAQDAQQRIRQATIDKARDIVVATESSREDMAKKWEQGVITIELLQGWARDGDIDRVIAAVPVVTALQQVMSNSSEGGYEFRVPKFQPRNPENEPDAYEAAVLRRLSTGELEEYYDLDESINSIRYFRPIRLTQECMLCHGDPATSREVWGNDEGRDPTGTRMENWKVGEVHGAFEIIQSLDGADAELRQTLWRAAGIIGALGLGSLALFFVLISRSINRPLDEVMRATRQVALGQMAAAEVSVTSNDEIGQLADTVRDMVTYTREISAAADRLAQGDLTGDVESRSPDDVLSQSFQRLIISLREVFGHLGKQADSLGEASDQLLGVATQTVGHVEAATTNVTSVAAAAEQMSVNMTSVSQAASESTGNITTVATATEEMTATITDISRSAQHARQVAESAVDTVGNAAHRVDELGKAAHRIGRVVEVIVDIADQTKLLALNATIEAASAGDAGKGFAVVANEVKELAKQTADATEEIRASILAIQETTSGTVSEIGEIGGVIGEVNENVGSIAAAVEEQAVTTRGIAQNVSAAAGAVVSVTENVSEAATASASIASEITSVENETGQVSVAMEGVNDQAQALARMGTQLRDIVGRYKLKRDE